MTIHIQQMNTAKSPIVCNNRDFAYLEGKKVVLSWSYRKTLP